MEAHKLRQIRKDKDKSGAYSGIQKSHEKGENRLLLEPVAVVVTSSRTRV